MSDVVIEWLAVIVGAAKTLLQVACDECSCQSMSETGSLARAPVVVPAKCTLMAVSLLIRVLPLP